MRDFKAGSTGAVAPFPGRVVAVLGPTNTGKTYFALERMLGHRSGMIGFPLRLLARENYERIVAARGAGAVALITGEEMIVPPQPHYFVCTVEAMPVDRPVAFLAVDEIQLCADAERGHIFTDRLLRARGQEETLFLGADTILPLIRRLVPRIEVISRPRFSSLSYAGHKKLTRLPPRSAVVAFSAADVYAMAEMIRRQRGGAAVVLGALSPRTRNAQVALYQAGDVDYLVATDAIGMGLNLDVDHVAFARLGKFDGNAPRRLNPHEIAQIAGRAGRHKTDGTFGTTGEVNGIEPEVVERVEAHEFEALKALRWRNHALRLDSAAALLRSLEERPPRPELIRAREADDHRSLAALAADAEVAGLAQGRERVELLWEVCRIPDFRKVLSDAHTRLLGQLFRFLVSGDGRLPTDWVARQVGRLDRTEGDIDVLISRIAHVRTWTYVSHRGAWLADAGDWQERTRAIEDRLSDALHDRLTQRFIDRRSATLVRSLRENGQLLSAVTADGDVIVEGHPVGRLEGFRFVPETGVCGEDSRALMSAARRALKDELARRVRALETEPDEGFALGADGVVLWRGTEVGRLESGSGPLGPAVAVDADGLLEPGQRDRVKTHLEGWVGRHVGSRLSPLLGLQSDTLSGALRGLAFQLVEGLGDLPRAAAAAQVDALDMASRQQLRPLGIRIGRSRVYLPALLKPHAVGLRAMLWSVWQGRRLPAPVPAAGRVSIVADPAVPDAYYAAIGYPRIGRRAVRTDMLDRFEVEILRARDGLSPERRAALASLLGCAPGDLEPMLTDLGFSFATGEDGIMRLHPKKGRRRRAPGGRSGATGDPFAKLRQLGGD